MTLKMIGRVSGLSRYPVKSMLGEELQELDVTLKGAVGDRAYALREVVSRHIASAKKFAKLLEFRATFDSPPTEGKLTPVTVTLPDGKKIHATDADASEVISAALGQKMILERAENVHGERAGFDPATIFGDVGVDKVFPNLTKEQLGDNFPLQKDSFFDTDFMHVIATGTLKHMATLTPGSKFDPRGFRPTILVDTGERADGFLEDDWIGGTLAVGDNLRIVKMQPALRCVMTTHPQQNLERDLAILRTAAKHHKMNVGVFASIGAAGKIRIGDPVYLDK